MSRPRSLFGRFVPHLGLTVAAIIFALLAAEIGLRITEQHIVQQDATGVSGLFEMQPDAVTYMTRRGKRMRPNSKTLIKNHRTSHRDVVIETNSLGFRDDEMSPVKPVDELRVLVLGDSITVAHYLPIEESYVQRAEHYLDETIPGRHIELINAGVSDIGLREEIDILEETGLLVDPDLIVLAFYLNDSRPPWGFPQEIAGRGWLRRHSVLAEKVYWVTRMRRWLREMGEDRFAWVRSLDTLRWRSDEDAFRQLADLARYDWGAAWQPDSWSKIDAEFSRLDSIANRADVPVAVLIFPVAYQGSTSFIDDFPQREVKKRTATRGWPTLDLLPLIRGENATQYFDQCHPNTRLHDLIGKAVAGFLHDSVPVVRANASD